MLRMILRMAVMAGVGRFLGRGAARNVQKVDRVARMARKLRR